MFVIPKDSGRERISSRNGQSASPTSNQQSEHTTSAAETSIPK